MTTPARFQEKAACYEARARVQAFMAGWLARWLEASPPPGAVVWELGAGTGFFTRQLLRRGFAVCASDLAPAMVARGRGRCPLARWEERDGWRLPRGVCDRLYSSSFLQWAVAPREVLSNWAVALRDGGRMLHGLYTGGTLAELRGLLPAASPVAWLPVEGWLGHVEGAGLRVRRHESLRRVVRYASARALLRSLHDTGVTGAPVLGAGCLRELMRCYDARFRHPGGGVVATWELLRFEAVR
jgi:SAM-dependent methyltransferase